MFIGKSPAVIGLACVLASNLDGSAAVIHVDDSAPATGANDGTSWHDAFTDLQEGLKTAQPGDELRVAQGNYKPAPPDGDRSSTFSLPDGVLVHGGFAGFGAPDPDANDPASFITVLSGDLNGDDGTPGAFTNYAENVYSVVTFEGTGQGSELRGVTVTAGSADVLTSCWPSDVNDRGGGIRIEQFGAQPLIEDCTITLNQAICIGGGLQGGSPLVRSCRFERNRMSAAQAGFGGGAAIASQAVVVNCMFLDNGPANNGGAGTANVFRNCQFIGNHAYDGGGAIEGYASAINCLFLNNSAYFGGAIWAPGLLVNCIFLGNTGNFGGALQSNGFSNLPAVNCLFSGNYAGSGGGAVYGPVALFNCTVVGNITAPNGFSGGAVEGSTIEARNCIFWDNIAAGQNTQQAQIDSSHDDDPIIFNSTIQHWDGSLGGESNSGEDPLFVDADGPDNEYGTEDDNARLTAQSSAIDAGNTAFLPGDEGDLDEDDNISEPTPLDLDLVTRVVNAEVDQGAYEFQGETGVCTADIAPDSGNGTVDVDDLLLVINNWGATGDNPADIAPPGGNGAVDVDDLLAVINAWGKCP